MECMEAQLKMQAILDNELDEAENPPGPWGHLESCYKCRDEYIDFSPASEASWPVQRPRDPSKEWFEELEGRKFRKGARRFRHGLIPGVPTSSF